MRIVKFSHDGIVMLALNLELREICIDLQIQPACVYKACRF